MQILILVIVVYLLIVFFDLRLLIPYLGFGKNRLQKDIPLEWQEKIEELQKVARTDYDFLKKSYDYITSRFIGSRVQTFFKSRYAFGDIFSHRNGYLPCTIQNELLRTMLILSGRFTEDDVRFRIVIVNFFIHQYTEVRIDGKWVEVDPWAKSFGIPFGKSAFLFV